MSGSSTLPPYLAALLPLALKEQSIINAERYISGELLVRLVLERSKTFPAAVGFTVLVYDLLLTLGDEVRYIWRRPITSIKVLYLILRYGVAIAQVVYLQGENAPRKGGLNLLT